MTEQTFEAVRFAAVAEAEANATTTVDPMAAPPVVSDGWPVPAPVPPPGGWDALVVV